MDAHIAIEVEGSEEDIDELYYQLSLKCNDYGATIDLFKNKKSTVPQSNQKVRK